MRARKPVRRRATRTRRSLITQGGRRRLDAMRISAGRAARRTTGLIVAAGTLAGALMWQTGGSEALQLVKVGIIVALIAILAIGVLAWRDGYGRGLLEGMGAEMKRRRNKQARSRDRAGGIKPRSQSRRKPNVAVAGRKPQQARTAALPARTAAKPVAPRRTPAQAYPLSETRRVGTPGMTWIGGGR